MPEEDSMSTDPLTGVVPDVIGETYPDAAGILAAAGYVPGRYDRESATVEVGLVIGTVPPPGAGWAAGKPVNVLVSAGS
jgi:beta-lactam-binding protein with PASTA domain